MKLKITFLLLLVVSLAYAQELYVKTFGDKTHPPIIYLHGGPGYNSSSFEATTAQNLADQGHFVIVYDRRGEGRSDQLKAAFTFEATTADLTQLYNQFQLEKATLIGHSFGGIVAVEFADKHPQKIDKIVLVGAPIRMQNIFQTIIDSTEVIYKTKEDTVNLNYIAMLKEMDKNSLTYSSYCFMHAMANGFYTPKNPSEKAQKIYAQYNQSDLGKYGQQMSYTAPTGFWENEQYTSIDVTEKVSDLKKEGLSIYGIYGQEDRLFSTQQIAYIEDLIGDNHLFYVANCAHTPYMDQQEAFLEIFQSEFTFR